MVCYVRRDGLFLCACYVVLHAPAAAQAPASPPTDQPPAAQGQPIAPNNPPTADDICRAVEEDAAANGLPVEFFARVIWQESRFNAQAVSPKGAQGIAQFMPRDGGLARLADPFDPIEALKHSASYLHDLREQIRQSRARCRRLQCRSGAGECVARRAPRAAERDAQLRGDHHRLDRDEWASPSPPQTAETTIPQGVPCTRLANLILAPKEQAQRIAAYVPRWGMQLTANWSESKAWAVYRMIAKQYAALIGDREPIVIRSRGIGLGSAMRYNIRIADDNRGYLEKFCNKLIAAGGACVVLRNDRG